MIKAILFDLDGVLIDSESVNQEIVFNFLVNKGIEISKEKLMILIGSHPSQRPWKEILSSTEFSNDYNSIEKEVDKYVAIERKRMGTRAIVFPEVKRCIRTIKKMGIRLAIASNSTRAYIKQNLKEIGVEYCFDLIVSGEDILKGKPDPCSYLKCVEHFGLSKKECLILEDSKLGIEAANRAGITVAARKNYKINLEQEKADLFFDNLEDIIKIIR